MEKGVDPGRLGSRELAYIGDAVFELMVRHELLRRGIRDAGRLTAASLAYSSAVSQARALAALAPYLNEEEAKIVRRGRNAKQKRSPKSAAKSQYRAASALESLFGYLWLSGDRERLEMLFAVVSASNGEERQE